MISETGSLLEAPPLEPERINTSSTTSDFLNRRNLWTGIISPAEHQRPDDADFGSVTEWPTTLDRVWGHAVVKPAENGSTPHLSNGQREWIVVNKKFNGVSAGQPQGSHQLRTQQNQLHSRNT